ncbi:hypothetical protein AMS68_000339 [Peltaster fructicola]|uniref:Carrier domain-containing protein n=1 Tax=Peltaster fructicola TaxID=286661 RepID=A0A6H0XJC9_9PEZI|nr:hypothetical protein AMS68_000339 [Peltaster fructicola]
MAENGAQQGSLRQFLASIATLKGDLSSATGVPPFVLADKSTTEFPRYWIEHPDLFCAVAHEESPEARLLCVLKWFVASLRGQQYAGRDPKDGVKKPLNAFLGELYLGEIGTDDKTKLVSEQVSHHPPVTACYLWNDTHGVRAEGYTRQEITFNGNVNIQQIGHAILHVDKYDEDYLIPLPNVRVKGILTGPYPELHGTYTIVSSSGYIAVVEFTGKGFLGFGGEKNHLQAKVYKGHKAGGDPLYTVEGGWAHSFTFKDRAGKEIDTYDVATAPATACRTLPIEEQDPWESQRAWKDVIDGIHAGDMRKVSESKTKLENAQRAMRKKPELSEDAWQPLFFTKTDSHPIAQRLHDAVGQNLNIEEVPNRGGTTTEFVRSSDNGMKTDERQQLGQLISQIDNGQPLRSTQLFGTASADRPSYFPVAAIYLTCVRCPERWSAFELCRRFWACWRCLPEDVKCGRGSSDAHRLISATLQLINGSYTSTFDLLHPRSQEPAIINPDNRHIITHGHLARLIASFALPTTSQRKPVVAIALPNGPLLATTLLATATYFSAAPVQYGPGVGAEQFKRDVLQSGSNFVLALATDVDRLGLRAPWIIEAQIEVLLIELDNAFVFKHVSGRLLDHTTWPQPVPNRAGDIAVLLFTSGTSGAKKLVPLHLESLVTGVAMVQSSWNLTETSRCLNQMPLNHVGGIVRNLFAPVMSGGSVICCSGFDANAFWDAVDDFAPTWYYASPTMHQCILDAAADRPSSVAKSQINLVCNAAGGLLPSLACQLRDTFSRSGALCTVLPSYGMTECMPISTPPLNYRLERTGTSGISVGPEIAILDGSDKRKNTGDVGRIAVRGAPIFAGYLKNGQLDRSCFTADGWFDTGDMGYLDQDGYLYITGRSKEVINRGGELISPFEVEDAILAAAKDSRSPIYGRVSKALAFSVPHDVLQEVVGVVVVTPSDRKRPCLKTIQEATKSSLASVKVPTVLVFMSENLPLNNNKVLRIRLAERLGINSISDSTPQAERYFEAICPAPNTPLTTNIRSRKLLAFNSELRAACAGLLPPNLDFHIHSKTAIHPDLWLAPKTRGPIAAWTAEESNNFTKQLLSVLDAYSVPGQIQHIPDTFVRNAEGEVDERQLTQATPAPATSWEGISQSETKIVMAFAEVLGIPAHSLNDKSDFFELGGDSMKAGRLLSVLRKSFATRITIDALFNNSSVGALTKLLGVSAAPKHEPVSNTGLVKSLPGCTETRSSTSVPLLLLQLIPIVIFAPMRRALSWTIFIYCLTYSSQLQSVQSLPGRFINLVVSLLIGKTVTEIFVPPLTILLKWLIIGRYKEGLYPMWAAYHTRWWLVQKIISIGGMGIYEHFSFTRTLYYRCLGAQIGRNATIDKDAKLGEYDLITIGDNVVLDACSVRPFAVERNTSMYLGRIRIGTGASVGQASFVAAGTTVPAGTCIGANSSSWELHDADEANRYLSPSQAPKPLWILEWLVAIPLVILANFVGAIPWMGGLMPIVITEPDFNTHDQLRETIIWFSSPHRVAFHYVALACAAAIGPAFFFFIVVAIKKTFDACCGGPIQAGPAKTRGQMDRLRMSLMRTLMPDRQFHKLTNLFGTHYAPTSVFARMLGAKVGKQVYWPGKGPRIQDFDMIEVGDSVVFGSRSSIITSDGLGTQKVKIGAGAMVADRVVLRPGSELGQKTVMGSGALTQRNKVYPPATTWVGSKKNDAVCLTVEAKADTPAPKHRFEHYRNTMDLSYLRPQDKKVSSHVTEVSVDRKSFDVKEYLYAESLEEEGKKPDTSSPFGRAFYQGLAPYRVWGQTTIAIYSILLTILCAVFWNIHSISAVQVVAWLWQQKDYQKGFLKDQVARPLFIYAFFTALIAAIMAVQIVVALLFVIGAKWFLLGRRRQGNYDWDKSSYCQRWQLFLKIEALRQKCYGGHGILGLLTGTHWIVLYFRALGANIGKDCALFASGTPSLYFTEPDLLTLGDRVSVDDASLVCHINTRGKFDLNPLHVGDRSVLRSGSRLLSGAKMEADSCLLEHTLVMAGDVVDAETAIQGWPGEEFNGNRLPTMKVAYHWETA